MLDGCWMDDVMRWLGIGGEREKVGHVGLGRGKRHFRPRHRISPVEKPEAEVKRSKGVEPEPEVKKY